MAIITTYKGFEILVDDSDYDWLNGWKWQVSRGYAVRRDTGKNVRMHRLILDLADGEYCDHINGNRLDNRRSNLRRATMNQNNQVKRVLFVLARAGDVIDVSVPTSPPQRKLDGNYGRQATSRLRD